MRRWNAASLAMALFAICSAQIQAQGQTRLGVPRGICIHQDRIDDWAVLSDTKLIVVDKERKKFRLSLTGACSALSLRTTLTFQAAGADGCLARHDGVVASLPGYPESSQRCLITDIDEYTAAMENADQIAEGTLYHHPDTHGEIGAIR
jgi:hypothetical protein